MWNFSWSVQLDISRVSAVEHEKGISIFTSGHVLFCLLCKHTNDVFFDDFFKISEDSLKVVLSPENRFWTFSEIAKDFWRQPNISEEEPMMFCHTGTHLRAMVIFSLLKTTCYIYEWNNMLFSRVKRWPNRVASRSWKLESTCDSVWPGRALRALASTSCHDLRSLWSRSNLHASQS